MAFSMTCSSPLRRSCASALVTKSSTFSCVPDMLSVAVTTPRRPGLSWTCKVLGESGA